MIGLCEYVMMDWNYFNMVLDMVGKVSEEFVVNRMLLRVFFVFLYFEEFLEVFVSIYGWKK